MVGGHRQGLLDELRLPAGPMRRNDEASRDVIGVGRAVHAAQQVQAAVESAAVPAEVRISPSST